MALVELRVAVWQTKQLNNCSDLTLIMMSATTLYRGVSHVMLSSPLGESNLPHLLGAGFHGERAACHLLFKNHTT